MRATCPAHLILLDVVILIIFGGVQTMQLLIMAFSAASCHFIPLRSRYFPKRSVHKHPQDTVPLSKKGVKKTIKPTGLIAGKS
jgi:hypothetical protein